MTAEPPSSEQPRSEPEILPPGRNDPRAEFTWSNDGVQRVYVTRLGPVSIALILLAIALIAVVLMVLVVGAFLIWIPVVAVLVAAAVVSAWWRQGFHRPR